VVKASGNNLKDVTAEFPLGKFVCVTGVSGGGKSTLTIETLFKTAAARLNGAHMKRPLLARRSRGSSIWTR
jgi:excinuclease ABC subunit A